MDKIKKKIKEHKLIRNTQTSKLELLETRCKETKKCYSKANRLNIEDFTSRELKNTDSVSTQGDVINENGTNFQSVINENLLSSIKDPNILFVLENKPYTETKTEESVSSIQKTLEKTMPDIIPILGRTGDKFITDIDHVGLDKRFIYVPFYTGSSKFGGSDHTWSFEDETWSGLGGFHAREIPFDLLVRNLEKGIGYNQKTYIERYDYLELVNKLGRFEKDVYLSRIYTHEEYLNEYPDEYSKSGYFHLTKNNLIRRVLECHVFLEFRIKECVSNSTRPSYEETCLLLHRELDKMYINSLNRKCHPYFDGLEFYEHDLKNDQYREESPISFADVDIVLKEFS